MPRFAARLCLALILLTFQAAQLGRHSFPKLEGDVISLPICIIQGRDLSSRFQGRSVQVTGVVTADFDITSQKGFFIQNENCDNDPATSDGIFIYLGQRAEVVSAGDRVRAIGLVQEYYGMTEIQVSPEDVTLLSSGNPLPAAQELNPPFDHQAARMYFEALEGMRIKLEDGLVVGPTDSNDRSWLVRSDLGVRRVLYEDPLGTGEVICVDDQGYFEIKPEVKTGDKVGQLEGVLDFRMGVYCAQLTALPLVQVSEAGDSPEASMAEPAQINLATFNLQNLFDANDDPLTADQVLSRAEYQRRLQKRAIAISQDLGLPAILGVQEAENRETLEALISQPEFTVNYEVVHYEGPDPRGLDVALLYRPDRATLLDATAHQSCTGLVDGFGPDGNDDPRNPQNLVTCDRNGDGIADGNRLFSRPPLAAHFLGRMVAAKGSNADISASDMYEFWVIVCHFKSKVGDSSTVEYTLPRRIEEARFVADLVVQLQDEYPAAQIVVLGDFNDHPSSIPLTILTSVGLQQTLRLAPALDRFSYIYEGVSQTLDDLLFVPRAGLMPVHPRAVHINADYPAVLASLNNSSRRSSDHDPLVVGFTSAQPPIFLPLVLR